LGNPLATPALGPRPIATLCPSTTLFRSVSVHTADAAGNVSDVTAAGALIVDTVAPAAPTLNSLVTQDSTPTLTGTLGQGGGGGANGLHGTDNRPTLTLPTLPPPRNDPPR